MKAVIRTVHDIKHPHLISCGIFMDEFSDKGPWEWTKQALKTLEEAIESYMGEVMAEASFQKQQLISGRFSTCQRPWRDKEAR
jgi:hypothetical protein